MVDPGRRPTERGRVGTVLAAAAVVGSLVAMRSAALQPVDRRVGARLARPRGPGVDRLMGVATDLGSVYGVAGAAAVLAATGRRGHAGDLAAAGGLAWCAAQAAKPLVDRPRPYQTDGVARLVAEPAGSSWPSGHAAVSAAMVTTLVPDLPPRGRWLARAAVAGVACSRLYVGVHHPTDVAAGVGIGVLCARAWRRVRRRRSAAPAADAPGWSPAGGARRSVRAGDDSSARQLTDSGSGRPTTER